MKTIGKIEAIILFVIIGIPFFILMLPVLIVVYPIRFFRRKQFKKKYAAFLANYDGKNFFCYNNRKKSKQYIEHDILPYLSEDIDVVYLNGRNVESDYDTALMSEALYNLKYYSGFPHLMKIRHGELIDTSINNFFSMC